MPKAGPDKQLCGAQRLNQPEGTTCTQRAGWGTDHPGIGRCKRHGGSTSSHNAHAEVISLQETAARFGISREIDPAQGLLELVWESAGLVEFYRQLVSELPTHPEPDVLTANDDGEPYWKRGDPGLYGRTYHVSGMPTGEAKRTILLQMYDDERDRLKGYIAEALRHNLDERRVRLTERAAREYFEVFGEAMTAAKLTPEQAETMRHVFSSGLRSRAAQLIS